MAATRQDESSRSRADVADDAPLGYVAIEGAIGVGKTSLACMLGQLTGAEVVLEEVDDSAFLPRFYEDRERFAFQTQVAFLLSRFRQQQALVEQAPRSAVCDYLMPVKERIFARLNLSSDELLLYEQLWQQLEPRVPTPDVLVLLTAPVEVLLQRIEGRGRHYEHAFDRAYLEAVAEQYARVFDLDLSRCRHDAPRVGAHPWGKCPLLVIDTTKHDLVASEADRDWLLAAIREHRQGALTGPHKPLGSSSAEALPRATSSGRDRDGGL